MRPKIRQLNIAVFIPYLICLLWLLFGRKPFESDGTPYLHQVVSHISLDPMSTIRLYTRLLTDPVRPILTRLAVINLFGNILMFVPLGYFLPVLIPRLRGFFRTLPAAAGMIALAEIAQVMLLVGTCDIDDLILNLLGVALGYPIFKVLFTGKKETA